MGSFCGDGFGRLVPHVPSLSLADKEVISGRLSHRAQLLMDFPSTETVWRVETDSCPQSRHSLWLDEHFI